MFVRFLRSPGATQARRRRRGVHAPDSARRRLPLWRRTARDLAILRRIERADPCLDWAEVNRMMKVVLPSMEPAPEMPGDVERDWTRFYEATEKWDRRNLFHRRSRSR